MKKFDVHLCTQFRVKVTGILAETMEDAITKAEANLSEQGLGRAPTAWSP